MNINSIFYRIYEKYNYLLYKKTSIIVEVVAYKAMSMLYKIYNVPFLWGYSISWAKKLALQHN